jgi:hypothetical protein
MREWGAKTVYERNPQGEERHSMPAEPVFRTVLLPRYTALYGAAVYSAPVAVKDFSRTLISCWRGTGLGSSPSGVSFQLQQSTDLVHWFDVGSSFTPANPGEETTVERDLKLEWVRLGATPSGATPGVTCWAVAAFVTRSPAH